MIGNRGLGILTSALSDNTNLKRLDLARNGLTSLGGLRKLSNCSLEILILSCNNIDVDEEIDLSGLKMLRVLCLGNNRLSTEGTKALISALQDKKSLFTLDLSSNEITSLHGFHMLANTCLENLYLDRCRIDDEGFVTLIGDLKHIKTLRSLRVSYNLHVSSEGWKMAPTLLDSSSSNLKRLSLYGNNFGDEVAVKFADVLANNFTLESLSLYEYNHRFTTVQSEAFSTLLCDRSNVESTFKFNHLLNYMNVHHEESSLDVVKYLKMNKDTNKKHVAIRKILHHHEDINMLPFFKWDLKMLPLMMKWLETAADIPVDFETFIDERKLSTIFQFVQNVSWQCTI